MNKEQLQTKYRTFTVKSEPASSCPMCQGKGEFVNARRERHICLCACLRGDEKVRISFVKLFQGCIKDELEKLSNEKKGENQDADRIHGDESI